MANKTITQLTQLTVGTGLGTDEIPIFHNNGTYKTTKNELFEGLGSKTFSGLNTEVKTITGAINELDKQLQQYIINKHAAPSPEEASFANNYYVRIGINKGNQSQVNYLPYAYLDIRDMANGNENPTHPGYYYGELKNSFYLYSSNPNYPDDPRTNALVAKNFCLIEDPNISLKKAYKLANEARTSYLISAVASNQALTANTMKVVTYNFTVPEGYRIVSVRDNSNYANLIGCPINTGQGDGTVQVIFNYFSTVAMTHDLHAAAYCVKV